MITIKEETIKTLLNNNKDYKEWTKILNEVLSKYEINANKQRLAMFIAQTAHESANYTRLTENLNYSQQGLLLVFPKYFNIITAKSYARNPEKIANRVYANRMGNGDQLSGDGWKYKGKGLIQITGKSNHIKFANFIDKSLEDTIAYMLTKKGALESACWFWKVNNLNSLADKADITKITRLINGGSNGLQDRISKYNKALKFI
jgi:putative chitinase